MIEILKHLGLSALGIVAVAVFCVCAKEIWSILKTLRMQASQHVLSSLLSELDERIGNFYLPLYQRFLLTEKLFRITQSWLNGNKEYDNSKAGIVSTNPRALRHVVVRRIFLPLNTEIERLIIQKLHFKEPDDPTDYSRLLFHYVTWRAFENATSEAEIDSYSSSELLGFPAEEAATMRRYCENLLRKRNMIRKRLIRLEDTFEQWFPNR